MVNHVLAFKTLTYVVILPFHLHVVKQASHSSISNMVITSLPQGRKRSILPFTQRKKTFF